MNENVKAQLLKSAEVMTETALDEALKVAEVLAEESSSPVDDGVVDAVKMLKSAFLDSLVDKIDGQEG